MMFLKGVFGLVKALLNWFSIPCNGDPSQLLLQGQQLNKIFKIYVMPIVHPKGIITGMGKEILAYFKPGFFIRMIWILLVW